MSTLARDRWIAALFCALCPGLRPGPRVYDDATLRLLLAVAELLRAEAVVPPAAA